MTDNARLTTHKIFLLPDYEKEGEYLTSMHKVGWKLEKACAYSQHFVKCEPENVIYKLDYVPVNSNYCEYIKMYSDYGWEHCGRVAGFDYFRRKADGISEEELEIFSDVQSKLRMMKKVIMTRMLPLLIIFIGIIIPNFLIFLLDGLKDGMFWAWAMTGVYTALILIYIAIFAYCIKGFMKLKKKYTE